ncbi:MAG: HAD family hydrolase [Burkholderiaceae bacterium]|nr:HAD family hydrolase [Burkholderiaceae bacterium]
MPAITTLTLDLDDTLWPVWPAIRRAEALLHDWLLQHAPATAAAHDLAALRRIRAAVAEAHPEWAHDLSALRRESIRLALAEAGDDPALAVPAFEVFFAARQQVQPFDDVPQALARLARRFRIVALSNGNADIQRVPGLGQHFHAAVSARELGLGKPAPEAFAAACQRAGCRPEQALHVGDDGPLDVDGALAAGLQAAWVCRPELPPPAAPTRSPQHVVATLAELAERLGC